MRKICPRMFSEHGRNPYICSQCSSSEEEKEEKEEEESIPLICKKDHSSHIAAQTSFHYYIYFHAPHFHFLFPALFHFHFPSPLHFSFHFHFLSPFPFSPSPSSSQKSTTLHEQSLVRESANRMNPLTIHFAKPPTTKTTHLLAMPTIYITHNNIHINFYSHNLIKDIKNEKQHWVVCDAASQACTCRGSTVERGKGVNGHSPSSMGNTD
ncbi:hypothetical protein LXL04_037706 [Taraxacum kok-saghyz]